MPYDVECPYCGKGQEINHDDGYGYEENDIHEQECPACEQTFIYTTSISFYYKPEKAACKNGGDHDYQKTMTFPPEAARMKCTVCWEEKPIGDISGNLAKKEAENEQANPADPICGTCDGSGEIPCPDGFAICRECWGR